MSERAERNEKKKKKKGARCQVPVPVPVWWVGFDFLYMSVHVLGK